MCVFVCVCVFVIYYQYTHSVGGEQVRVVLEVASKATPQLGRRRRRRRGVPLAQFNKVVETFHHLEPNTLHLKCYSLCVRGTLCGRLVIERLCLVWRQRSERCTERGAVNEPALGSGG